MKKLLTLMAFAGLFGTTQSVLAANCELDPASPIQLTTTEMYFDSQTTLQTVTIKNNSLNDVTLSTSINGHSSWFIQSLNCDGATLFPGTTCTVTVNFYPATGGENRKYNKRMVVSGEASTGEYDQTVCLNGSNQ